MSTPTAEPHPLRIAIVGSGPSAFYAAEDLFKSGREVRVDMLERLPAPYGLVRHGVAPDHQKLKEPIRIYEGIARHPGFRLFGNVTVGKDVTVEELRAAYHAVLFCTGAETDRRLGIPGEDLPGSHTATEFVGWYNAHPDYRDRQFDLSQEVAVIIGQGNVAIDVARILAKTVDELKHTDIAEHALACLAASRIREIHLIGRRGPAQAKFTTKEFRELGELADCEPVVDPADLDLNPESRAELEERAGSVAKKNLEVLRTFAARGAGARSAQRRVFLRFLLSPVELRGEGRVEQVVLERNRLEGGPFHQVARGTGQYLTQACGLVFRSIGYRGVAIPGVPFDARQGVFPTRDGRIVDAAGIPIPGLYASGWIKRGPTGIIGTNRADSMATLESLLADLDTLDRGPKPGAEGVPGLTAAGHGALVVGFEDWLVIDRAEVQRGAPKGKPREKFTRREEMLRLLRRPLS
ncbi:MAG TPA: FAD-dependent oxidoreductase [Gemmatimonadales bacterium]|nr:FAD-dependent oxidoreductase [Gemmatimonadales bacterium]